MKKNQINEDFRLEEISNKLIQFSLGNFDEQLPLSETGDDIDAIIAGVNMLGEELKHVTISNSFLKSIYNSISEMLIVADLSGNIEEVNPVACDQLGFSKFDLLNKNLFDFIRIKKNTVLTVKNNKINIKNDKVILDGELIQNQNVKLKCSFAMLSGLGQEPSSIILIAEDVTEKIAREKLVIRTIIDTQEKERNRFASDLHDSLGQQLSGIRFYISAIQHSVEANKKLLNQYDKTLKSIDNAIIELRDICFNLMPRTLENHTLKFSLGELASKFNVDGHLKLSVEFTENVPKLNKAFEIACFRIVQEFLNNAIKHGKATIVEVNFSLEKPTSKLKVLLKENGIGFDLKILENRSGMGLRNIKTRVESYYGSLEIHSAPDKGTQMEIKFPLAFVILH